ncbi:GIY-YIG nuclease family protein [Streptomyces sp. NPDC059340]|uniref:GIY-YIG nuclease family protein n=1 Tax=Streptomyces sp. NPDC059340 TaxID=3346806 RepID=UPI0036CEDE44
MKEPEHFPARKLDRSAPVRELLQERRGPFNVEPFVYRFYSSDRKPLYIGFTHGGAHRWDNHRRESEWWPLAEYVAVSFYGTHAEALTAEMAAIRAERPAFNRQGLVPRKQVLIKFEHGAEAIAAELHQIADPDLVRQLAELLAAPHLFPGSTPPPAPVFPARE